MANTKYAVSLRINHLHICTVITGRTCTCTSSGKNFLSNPERAPAGRNRAEMSRLGQRGCTRKEIEAEDRLNLSLPQSQVLRT